MRLSEVKLLDRIFTEAALSGIDIGKLDIVHNQEDFGYVLERICVAHRIEVHSLFDQEQVKELSERNTTPSLSTMMYFDVDDENGEELRFIHFCAPKTGFGMAERVLQGIARMLHENYGVGVNQSRGCTR